MNDIPPSPWTTTPAADLSASDATPRVDVVIPVYNGAKTIVSSIGSIQAQSERSIRIIVIDDGSTDTTVPIVQQLAAGDPRITLLSQANSGIVDALNVGLSMCRATFIARHDADDLASPDRFEKQLAYLDGNPDCVAVSGAVRQIDEDGHLLRARASQPSPDLADPTHLPQIEPYLIHPFLMMRRSAVGAVGGYRHVFHAEDSDLYWRLQEVGRLYNMPDILGDYRIHDASVSGLSVVNGRISSINSQRSGISAMRRRAGRPDIRFPKEDLAGYQSARSLEDMMRVATRDLDAGEAQRLAASAGLKLLDSASYRPYDIDGEDCAFIRKVVPQAAAAMTRSNRQLCARMMSGTAARLLLQGRFAEAFRLVPMPLYPAVAVRLVIRVAVPRSVRGLLQRLAGREASAFK